MYSTLFPINSTPVNRDALLRTPTAAYGREKKPSHNHFSNIPVAIEGNGAVWEGKTEMLTRSSLRLLIEGCPLVVLSQSLQLQIRSQQADLEMVGLVQGITPMGDPVEGHWSRVQLEITYECLDDLKWHQLKLILGDASPYSSSSHFHLRGTLIPLDPGESLWKMKPTSCGNDTGAIVGKVEEVFSQISQSNRPFGTAANCLDNGKRIESVHSADVELLNIPIVSTHLEFPNSRGQLIRAYYDAPESALPPDNPVMILMPGYGETKREYITLAYYLASNGFHVLRYDHTNHVGESDGEHVNTTLSMMREDLDTVVNYVAERWPHSERGLVATSLSGRVAIKGMATETQVDLLVLITPVVDVQHTLQAVHQEDLVGNYQNGERKGVSNVLGFNVSVSHWLADAINEKFSDVQSTVQDVSTIRTPVVIVSAELDTWVQHASLNTISTVFGKQLLDWYVIPGGLHRILENPRKAKLVYRQITEHGQKSLGVLTSTTLIMEPTRKAIGLQNKREREQMKAGTMTGQLSEFWKDYLDHFHHIVNYGDYQQLLDHMLKLMGTVSSGETILDAGCGNGNFAPFFYLHERLKKHSLHKETPKQLRYVGIDFVSTALQQAQENFQTVVSRHQSDDVAINSTFSCTDLNQSLPFQSGTFDKIVSNLVLGYLNDPVETLRELFRVLSPNGILVLSNLKPNSDLSVIYTNSVQETTQADEVEEARQLLSNSGKIRQAEGDGLFQFHDEEGLRHLLQQVDPNITPKVYSTFANQAYIAVIKKESVLSSKPVVSTTTFADAA